MSNLKKITTERAEITTATIQVKTLMVDARKLTLSVFRQIREGQLIDHDSMQLRGTPWGIVNYYWGDMSTCDLHVVWQSGSELRRSLVPETSYNFNRHLIFDRDHANKLIGLFNETLTLQFNKQYEFLVEECGFKERVESESDHDVAVRAEKFRDKNQELIESRNKQYTDIYNQLLNLPHLFIAV